MELSRDVSKGDMALSLDPSNDEKFDLVCTLLNPHDSERQRCVAAPLVSGHLYEQPASPSSHSMELSQDLERCRSEEEEQASI